ncbi:sodium-dependent nutrient amino acid transporter 1-like isoform X2 [Cimex lectularius]|uniref:Sodium-dependent nutrient amino acid transporter 1 n=1 Tax=Cimex lectularius TaxID=79782 RepID=A0A8I6RFW8_CIMLE|nr:sodium-dependent nutrient amino acid transporter 1-like isoform X2 [Cimex lectularius]
MPSNSRTKPSCSFFPRLSTILVALSLTFSLGNILRLPRVVYMHGGGTFLIIYIVVTILFGIPLTFLEIVLGQFCQQGTTKIWRAVPLLKGVGYVKVLCSFFLAVYYPVVMVISLFFALWSIKGPLPFQECVSLITSLNPITKEQAANSASESCLEKTFLKSLDKDPMWFGVNVTLLFLIWAFIMLCVSRGVKSYRISAFCLGIPLIGGLIALLTQQLTIDMKGLSDLFKLSLDPVWKFDTWYYAVVQFFFSTHIGFGNITTCSGNIYSKSNAFWTAFLYILCNVVIGVAGVFLVYLWLGRIAISEHLLEVPLLFVMNVIYNMGSCCFGENGQIWAMAAFVLLIFSGFTSMVALVYTIAVSVSVESKNKWRSWMITGLTCAIGFIIGVAIMLPEKLKFLHMLDYYVIGHMVAMSTALELIGFIWIYGINSIRNDFEFVLGYKLSKFWNTIWFTTPIFLVGIEIASLFFLPLTGEDQNADDYWVYLTGWVLYGFLWFIIVVIAIWQISAQVDYNFGQKLLSSLKPTRNWGPVDPICRHSWVQWRDSYQATGERDFTLKRRGTRDYTHSIKSENRYNTMSLPRNPSQYVVSLPDGVDLSDHPYWRRDLHTPKKSKT